jgi:type II secretory pathway pseudopilin PulG
VSRRSGVFGVRARTARGRCGFTAVELVVVCAIMGVFCSIAVPSAVGTRRALGADTGARHLALVLREAQARAQSSGARTSVQVAPDGSYEVAENAEGGWRVTERGELLSAVATNYPNGRVEFGRAGWPLLGGTVTPRAGSFVFGSAGRTRTVVLQLTGCVRCR